MVSGAGWRGQRTGAGLRAQGRPGANKVWAPSRHLAPAASPFGLPHGHWSSLVGTPTCLGSGPLHHDEISCPRQTQKPRAQSNLGQPSASPAPSLQRRVVLLQLGLGRVLPEPGRAIPKLGGEKQLRAQSGLEFLGSHHSHPSWALLEQLSALLCLSFPLFTDRLVVLLPVLVEGGVMEKGSKPQAHPQMPPTPVPFGCQALSASQRKVRNEGD